VRYSDHSKTPTQISQSLIHSFKWLDYLVNSESLSDEIMEILRLMPLVIQKEVVEHIPHIGYDAEMDKGWSPHQP
jgi:hypothetical protein